MISLTPTERTQREVGDFLRQLDELADPPASALRPIQEGIRAGFDAIFATEGAAGEAPWAQLAEMTRREREKQGFPAAHPILERTGIYRRSFVDEHHVNHVSQWDVAGGIWTIEEGSSDERADDLEYGTPIMPERPVTILGAGGEARLSYIIDDLFDGWFE
jgi:hypothetical protein